MAPSNVLVPITRVIIAFFRSDIFVADEPPAEYPLSTTIDGARSGIAPSTKVTVANREWGDWKGFQTGAKTSETRRKWAEQVRIMVDRTGADGVDIYWEYPGYLLCCLLWLWTK